MLPVPITEFSSSSFNFFPFFETSTSRLSSLIGKHAFKSPSGVFCGISFNECTAKSILFSSISFSISFTNKSFCVVPFIFVKSLKSLSPFVTITFSSISSRFFFSNPSISQKFSILLNSSYFLISISFTFSACASAKMLPRVPIIILFDFIYFHPSQYFSDLYIFFFFQVFPLFFSTAPQ